MAQSGYEHDFDIDMAQTYGLECDGGVSDAQIKALEAKIDALNKPCPKPAEAPNKTKVAPAAP